MTNEELLKDLKSVISEKDGMILDLIRYCADRGETKYKRHFDLLLKDSLVNIDDIKRGKKIDYKNISFIIDLLGLSKYSSRQMYDAWYNYAYAAEDIESGKRSNLIYVEFSLIDLDAEAIENITKHIEKGRLCSLSEAYMMNGFNGISVSYLNNPKIVFKDKDSITIYCGINFNYFRMENSLKVMKSFSPESEFKRIEVSFNVFYDDEYEMSYLVDFIAVKSIYPEEK